MLPESQAAWVSGLISRQNPSQAADVDLTGATRLYLSVRGGPDGTAWDHADWLNPALGGGGKTIPLNTLLWRSASAGWGKPTVNKSVSGAPLKVAGQLYEAGIGTHANSIVEYDLPVGYSRFTTTVGLDQAAAVQNTGGTLKFLVFTQSPYQPAPADSVRVLVLLKELGLATTATVQDLWSGRKVGVFTTEFAPYIRRHGAALYRISGQKAAK
jgi:hypothetical protein